MSARGETARTDLIAAGFILAVKYLYSDTDARQHYFDDGSAEFQYEFYPPLHAIPSSVDRSEALNDALRDGAFPSEGGYVFPVSDPKCDWWDAARHISHFKRNMITVPRTDEEFDAWYYAGHNEYQRKLKRLNALEQSALRSGGSEVFRANRTKSTWKSREVSWQKRTK
jgi:hypothetical protein